MTMLELEREVDRIVSASNDRVISRIIDYSATPTPILTERVIRDAIRERNLDDVVDADELISCRYHPSFDKIFYEYLDSCLAWTEDK